MKTLSDFYAEDTTRTAQQVLDLYHAQPPEPRPSSPATFVTYTSIGQDKTRFGAGAINVAGRMQATLEAWTLAPDLTGGDPASPLPNPGALKVIHSRLMGETGQDLSSPDAPAMLSLFAAGVGDSHPPAMSGEQATAMLTIGWVVPNATIEDAEAAILGAAKDAALVALATYESSLRDAINAAETVDSIPEIPTL